MSYRTRRSLDPWFDRLTTLSKVEGVSSRISLYPGFLAAGGPPPDSGKTECVIRMKRLSILKTHYMVLKE
jgi:hypothetical protein